MSDLRTRGDGKLFCIDNNYADHDLESSVTKVHLQSAWIQPSNMRSQFQSASHAARFRLSDFFVTLRQFMLFFRKKHAGRRLHQISSACSRYSSIYSVSGGYHQACRFQPGRACPPSVRTARRPCVQGHPQRRVVIVTEPPFLLFRTAFVRSPL